MEQPVQNFVRIGQVNEEAGKDEEWADEKWSEDGAVLEGANEFYISRCSIGINAIFVSPVSYKWFI